MTQQMEFIPRIRKFNVTGEEPVIMYNLDDLPPNDKFLRGKISPDTYRSIKENGQLYPILIAKTTDGNIAIIDGEQRVKIQRKLGVSTQIPAIFYPEDLDVLEVGLLRTHMNNARQENPVADIDGIRLVKDYYPSANAKRIAAMTGINLSRVRSLMKQANMPQIFIDAVKDGTMSKDTLSTLSKKPVSVIRKAEQKYGEERAKISVTKDSEGRRVYKRLEDGFEFKNPPILLTAGDVKDFQRVSVQNTVSQAPMSMKIDFQESVEGFAAVKDGKFVTDLFDTADEVRLELGRKSGVLVKVRSI
jgi:ParB-like chromosome segregation protein Spo0J